MICRIVVFFQIRQGEGRVRSGGVSFHVVGNVRYPLVLFIGVFDGFSFSLAPGLMT